MPQSWTDKDPDDILRFGLTIKGLDDGDYIQSTHASIIGGDGSLVIVSHAAVPNSTRTVTKLSGGTSGQTYQILIRSTFNSGDQVDETMSIKMTPR